MDPDVHDEDITQASLDVLSPDIFLLPHMSLRLQPTWQNLENATRALVQKRHIRQVFVLNAPVSYFELNDVRNMTAVYQTGDDDLIPQGFIKSVLAQDMDGAFHLWTFELPNTTLDGALCDYLVSTTTLKFWLAGGFGIAFMGRFARYEANIVEDVGWKRIWRWSLISRCGRFSQFFDRKLGLI